MWVWSQGGVERRKWWTGVPRTLMKAAAPAEMVGWSGNTIGALLTAFSMTSSFLLQLNGVRPYRSS